MLGDLEDHLQVQHELTLKVNIEFHEQELKLEKLIDLSSLF